MPKKLKIPLDDRPSEIKTAEKKKGSVFQESKKKSLESLRVPKESRKGYRKHTRDSFFLCYSISFFKGHHPGLDLWGGQTYRVKKWRQWRRDRVIWPNWYQRRSVWARAGPTTQAAGSSLTGPRSRPDRLAATASPSSAPVPVVGSNGRPDPANPNTVLTTWCCPSQNCRYWRTTSSRDPAPAPRRHSFFSLFQLALIDGISFNSS